MSFIPASSDRDLFGVLELMVGALLVVGLRALWEYEAHDAGAPVNGNGSSGGSEGVMTDAEASVDEGVNGEAH